MMSASRPTRVLWTLADGVCRQNFGAKRGIQPTNIGKNDETWRFKWFKLQKNDVNLSIQHTTRKTTVGIQAANREIWDTNSNMAMSPDFRLSERLVPNIRSSVLGHGPFMCVVVDTAGLPSSLRNALQRTGKRKTMPVPAEWLGH